MRGGASLDTVRAFYDQLAGDYHLIYADWRHAVRRQGAALDRLVRTFLGEGAFDVLDCACGIGTQAIGLALRGHRVHATDLSAASVERARAEAAAFGTQITFGVADFRRLDADVPGEFDAVIACDNALPHLVSDGDLDRAVHAMRAKLRPGGLLVASLRDYDEDVRAKPRATEPQVFDDEGGRRIVFQVWDWAPDGRTYDINLFIARGREGEWDLTQHRTTYRALLRSELSEVLTGAGFAQVRWHTPAETGFFQPLVTARNA